ncbi:MAG TPA: sensor histidine kinase [Pseudonocardiaceae bacterium]|nr:sensor histidine kinase [Pseudonocardiaceae bacterium]
MVSDAGRVGPPSAGIGSPSVAAGDLVVDGVLAAGLVLFVGVVASDPAVLGPSWLGWPVAVALCAPVAVRRRWPVAALAAVLGAFLAAVGMGVLTTDGGWTALLAPAVVLYAVGRAEPARRVVDVGLAALVGLGVAAVAVAAVAVEPVIGARAPWETAIEVAALAGFGVAELGLFWLAGRAVRQWRALAARSARLRTEGAVAGERLRIARELHDVVAHSLSQIAVEAATASHLAATGRDRTGEALRVIESTSRAALEEMRRLLGVLRSGDAEPEALVPAPGLDELPALAGRSVMPVELDVRTGPGVPDGVQLSAYRIVQEALTNVARHAGAAPCRVVVEAGGGEVRVEVTDRGPGPPPGWDRAGGRHGLIGMRERVALYGGTFTAGPGTAGGFTVTARLPYGRPR